MKKFHKSTSSRLARIEDKCDIILSELLALRGRLKQEEAVDKAIERLHASARRARAEAREDAALLRSVFHIKGHGDER